MKISIVKKLFIPLMAVMALAGLLPAHMAAADPTYNLVFPLPSQIINAGSASTVITIQLQDTLGNPHAADDITTVNLTSTSPAGRFDVSAGGSFNGSIASVDIQTGNNSASFYYMDTLAGMPTITAAAEEITSGTQSEQVVTGNASKLVFTTAAQILQAGVPSLVMTVQTLDQFNNVTGVSANTTANLTTTSAAAGFDVSSGGLFNGSITSVTILAGQDSASFYYWDPTAGTPIIRVAANGLTSVNQTETVQANVPAMIVFTSAPQSMIVGTPSPLITIQTQDVYNNPSNVAANTTANLTSTSAGGLFDISAGGSFNGTVTSIIIPAGNNSTSFYYEDTLTGAPAITANASGLTTATQVEHVYGVPAALAFTTAPQTILTGAASAVITVQTRDSLNNPTNLLSATSVNLTSTSPTGRFDVSAGGSFNGTVTSVTIGTGANSTSFYYKDTASGTPTITANATGLTGASQVITINVPSAPPSGGGGGGGGSGGGGGMPGITLGGLSGTLTIGYGGYSLNNAILDSTDGNLELNIPFGIKILNPDGSPVTSLSVAIASSPPQPPPGNAIVLAYDLEPTGVTFSSPIALTFKFDPAKLPAGVNENSLVIAFWNGSQWQTLSTTINANANTATTQISHFSIYALMAPLPAVTTPVVTTTPSTTATPAITQPSTTPSATPIVTTPSTPVIPSTPASTTPAPATPSGGANWPLTLAIVGAVIIVGAIILLLSRRRTA